MLSFFSRLICGLVVLGLTSSYSPTHPKVQICLLIDASNSMEQLIAQAQTLLWQSISKVKEMTYEGNSPQVEVALLTYGHHQYVESDHIHMVFDFTAAVDSIALGLFSIRMGGGEEYCGKVISRALDSCSWDWRMDCHRFILIAGNESFYQGSVSPDSALGRAEALNVQIGSAYCGSESNADRDRWMIVEDYGGTYRRLDLDSQAVSLETPYDEKLSDLFYTYQATFLPFDTSSVPVFSHLGNVSPAHRDLLRQWMNSKGTKRDAVDIFDQHDWEVDSVPISKIPAEWREWPKSQVAAKLLRLSRERQMSREAFSEYANHVDELLRVENPTKATSNNLADALDGLVLDYLKDNGFE